MEELEFLVKINKWVLLDNIIIRGLTAWYIVAAKLNTPKKTITENIARFLEFQLTFSLAFELLLDFLS